MIFFDDDDDDDDGNVLHSLTASQPCRFSYVKFERFFLIHFALVSSTQNTVVMKRSLI